MSIALRLAALFGGVALTPIDPPVAAGVAVILLLLAGANEFLPRVVRRMQSTEVITDASGTIEVIHNPPISASAGLAWELTIDRERWVATELGQILAVHVALRNRTGLPTPVPRFVIDSGALMSTPALARLVGEISTSLEPLPEIAEASASVEGWLLAMVARRCSGGYPAYFVKSDDIPGNWRGVTRPPSAEPREVRQEESADIADGLAHWYWWGGQIKDEIAAQEEAYRRNPQHWIDALGGSEEVARGKLFRGLSGKHQQWAQGVHAYLRDRIGTRWSDRFDGIRDRNLLQWIEAELELLDSYIAEFRD